MTSHYFTLSNTTTEKGVMFANSQRMGWTSFQELPLIKVCASPFRA